MRLLAIVLIALAAGCRSAERRASDEQIDCVYHALTDKGMTDDQRSFVSKGCHSVWQMRTRRFGE